MTGKQSCVSDVIAWHQYLIRFDRQKSQMQKVIHFFWEAQYQVFTTLAVRCWPIAGSKPLVACLSLQLITTAPTCIRDIK